jgi:hypothetical protein
VPGLVDKDGLPVQVTDPGEAESLLRTGALDLRTDTAVTLVDSAGQVVDADAQNVPTLLEGGYRLATDAEVTGEEERQQYGVGLGNELLTLGESALSGATLGLSDVGARLLSDDYAADLAKRRDYNPTSAMIGEGVGVIGSVLATGGTGALAKGAAAIGTPARLLTGVSEAAAAGLAGRVGAQTVLGKAGANLLGYGLAGAAEGALFGAAKVATDDYLRDHEITAERIITGAGTGAVWGGALGGAMGAGASLLGSGMQRLANIFEASDAERVAARQLDDLTSAEAKAAADANAAVRADADARVAQEVGFRSDDQIVAELTTPPTLTEQQTAWQKLKSLGDEANAEREFKRLQQEKTTELVARGDRLNTAADDLASYTNVSLKPAAFKPLFEQAPPASLQHVGETTANRLGKIRDTLEKAGAATDIYEKGGLRALRAAVEDVDQITGALTGVPRNVDDLTDMYIGVDRLKRRLGRLQDAAGRGTTGDPGAQAVIRDAYEQLRNHLEDTTVFGGGAPLAQREINAAWSRYLDYAGSMSKSFEASDAIQRSASDGFAKVANFDPAKVGSVLSNLGKAENGLREKVWAVGIERKADLLEALGKWYQVPDELQGVVKAAREDASAMVRDMRDLRALNETAERYRDQLQTVKDTPFLGEQAAKLKVTVSKAVGFLSKTDAKAAARAAAESGANVHGQTAVRLATKGEQASEGAAKGLITWLKDSAITAGKRAAKTVRTTADTIVKAGPLMGVSMDLRNPATYERAVQNIGVLQDPKSDERKIIRARANGLRQENPELADALEAHTQRVADFLASKAGTLSATPKPGDPFGNLRKPRHDPAKAAKLARYMDAAQNPGNALKRIAGGDIRREDIETLKTLYPRMYMQVVERVMADLGSVEEMPNYQARLKLGHLLDAPADPSMTPERVAALQQVAMSNAQPNAQAADNGTLAPSNRREPRLSKLYATRSQQVADLK